MKSRYRGPARCLLVLGMLGVFGCAEDNNAQFLKEHGASSSSGSSGSSGKTTSYADFGKSASMPKDYPGAAKATGSAAGAAKTEPAKK